MKKIILPILLIMSSCAFAQVKVQDLTEDTSPSATADVGYSIKNYAGTPLPRKVKWGNISKLSGWELSGSTISPVSSSYNVSMAGNVTAGAFYGDGSHLTGISAGGGSGSGTVNSGTAGYLTYYPSTGTTVDDLSILYSDGTNLGLGTTSLSHKLEVSGTINASGAITGSNLSGTNTGDQTITLSGDISGSGTTAITTAIGNSKVTNAMLAGSIAASKLIGTDITSLGTVTTGTWNATTIDYTRGGTGLTSATDDNVLVGSGIGWASKTLPSCADSAGQHLNYDSSSNSFSCGTTSGTTVSAGGSDTQVQFNDGGTTLAGSSVLTLDKTINASSGTENPVSIAPTIAQSGTAGFNGLNINVTESSTGSGTKNLINLAVAGTSKAAVDDTGAVTATSYTTSSTSAGSLQLNEASANGANFRKFTVASSLSGDATITLDGTDGTTITFPAVTGTLATLDSPTFTTFLKLPQGTGPTVDAAGKIAIDTTNDQLDYYGGAKRVISYIHSKSFVIDAATSTADYVLWRAPYAVTITAIHVRCTGGTNVIGGLDEGDSNGTNVVAVDSDITASAGTMAADDGSLTNPTIASGRTVNWHTTSVSGTNTSLMVTFEYTIDAT